MSLTREAIERLEELTRAAYPTPVTDIPVLVTPSHTQIKSLEQFQEAPSRFRGTYRTQRLTDWCSYVAEEASAGESAAFVLPSGKGAMAVIDYGGNDAPMWGEHQAVLAMQHTPEFAALLDACKQSHSQRSLTDWIEDWQDIIAAQHGAESMSIGQAVQAIRKVDIKATASSSHEDGDFRGARTSMEEIEARSGSGHLPELFSVRCRVYPCTEEREIRVRLGLLTSADTPAFRLRILGEGALMQEVAQEVEGLIRDELGDKIRVFIGEV